MNAIARSRVRLEGVGIFLLRMRMTKLALLDPDAKNWWDKYKNHFMK